MSERGSAVRHVCLLGVTTQSPFGVRGYSHKIWHEFSQRVILRPAGWPTIIEDTQDLVFHSANRGAALTAAESGVDACVGFLP